MSLHYINFVWVQKHLSSMLLSIRVAAGTLGEDGGIGLQDQGLLAWH